MARPTFKPTAVMKRKVAVAAGGGMSHEEIALGLGISRPTLVKHFELELSTGANGKRLEILNAMFTAAKKGNVAAQKAYMATTPAAATPPAAPEPKAPAKGKKAQQQEEAVGAAVGSDWNDLLPARVH